MNYQEVINNQIEALQEQQEIELNTQAKCEIATTISLLAVRGNDILNNK